MTWQSRMVLGSIFAVVLVIGLPDLSLGVGTCRDEKNCPCKESEEAWKEYKKHLKVAEGLYDDAFGESDRALKEFDEAMDEVMGELGMIGGGMTGEEIASMVVERSLKEAAKQALSDLEMINTLGTEVVSDVVAVPATLLVTLMKVAMAYRMLTLTIDDLEHSAQSQQKMFLQGDEKWKQTLADFQKAREKDEQCAKEKLRRAEAERKLEKRAERYLQENSIIAPDGHDIFYVGNKKYKDAQQALEAAKQLLSPPGQSGFIQSRYFLTLATHRKRPEMGAKPTQPVSVPITKLKAAKEQINLAISHIRTGTAALEAAFFKYGSFRDQMRFIRSQMGTGQ